MDSLFAGFVAEANSIATSGRWEAVNTAVERWAKRSKTEDEFWYGQLFSSFCYRIFTEYHALKAAYAATSPHQDLALLAWRARNLLELSVWTTFCAKDGRNARQFFGDLGRDTNDFLKALKTWGKVTNQRSDWFKHGDEARNKLASRASARGVMSIDGKFTKVSHAAKEVGLEQEFAVMNKFLSKYAHPTAMFILGNTESSTTVKDALFAYGCLYFAGAFAAVENISKAGDL